MHVLLARHLHEGHQPRMLRQDLIESSLLDLLTGAAERPGGTDFHGLPAEEFAHLTRSEYIKLKAQRRHAALTIQMQIKARRRGIGPSIARLSGVHIWLQREVYLVRQYMCWSSRAPSIKRIQAYCWRYLAQAGHRSLSLCLSLSLSVSLSHSLSLSLSFSALMPS